MNQPLALLLALLSFLSFLSGVLNLIAALLY